MCESSLVLTFIVSGIWSGEFFEISALVATENVCRKKFAAFDCDGNESNFSRRSFSLKEKIMIARIWHGTTSTGKADEYLEYLNETGIPYYRATEGNRGADTLRRIAGDTAHIYTLSFWNNLGSIKEFAGEDYERARYYPEDEKFLLEFSRKTVGNGCEIAGFDSRPGD